MKLHGLYVITDERLTPWDTMPSRVQAALEGGVKLVQLRDKSRSDEELLDMAKMLACLCEKYDALFIVNDRVGLALACGAHGLHIGRDDGEVERIRAEAGSLLLGVSCYGDVETALRMQSLGVDYCAFGSVFGSLTKLQAGVVGVEILREAKKRLNIPVCAIGGICQQNASSCVEAGADMLAVVSSVWGEDVTSQAAALSGVFR